MKDAIFGVSAALVVLACLCFSSTNTAPTLQGIFEDVEQYKANKSMREQIEQARRTIEENKGL